MTDAPNGWRKSGAAEIHVLAASALLTLRDDEPAADDVAERLDAGRATTHPAASALSR